VGGRGGGRGYAAREHSTSMKKKSTRGVHLLVGGWWCDCERGVNAPTAAVVRGGVVQLPCGGGYSRSALQKWTIAGALR